MPADITGTEILEETPDGHRQMQFVKGPIFANVILADEINRTPPKTQAALLEAMQEHQVTAAGVRYPLDEPFFVLATQNPIEMEGTYPLPEAQLDRFMFNVEIDYLPEDDEVAVVDADHLAPPEPIEPLFTGEDVRRFHDVVRKVPIAEDLVRYAVRLAAASRPGSRVRRISSTNGSAGAPACGRRNTWCWAPRPGRCSKAGRTWPGRYPGPGGRHAPAPHPGRLPGRGRRGLGRSGDRPAARSRRAAGGVMRTSRSQPRQGGERHPAQGAAARTSFIDPASLMRIRNLELRARTVVEGFFNGMHRSPYHGFSVEFSEYRQYTVGDDPRYLDWRLFARSDRYYVKRFEDETNLRCYLLVDISRSMGFGSLGYNKAEYARTAAATLAYFLSLQRDARRAGDVRRADSGVPARPVSSRTSAPPDDGAGASLAGTATDLAPPLEQVAKTAAKRGMIVLISDLLAPIDALETQLGYLRSRGTRWW